MPPPNPSDASSADEPLIKLRDGDMAARAIEDETIVLDLRSSTYFSANAAASALWRELKRGSTRTKLVRALTDHFDVEPDVATRDVDAFLADCQRHHLLEEVRDAG
jgi:Coenzyme PQQ synthesis protein D (PqqD)